MATTEQNDENLYNISHWGDGYFSVNEKGDMEICKTKGSKSVPLQAIVDAADKAGLHLPVLIRCSDILHDRVARIYQAFQEARQETQYQGQYQLVYPIKVNQQQCVVKELLNAKAHQIGLEAGSKPELMAVIGMLDDRKATIICNGYKDSTYIRTALIAQQMGHKVFIIIEKISELDIILHEAQQLGIKPNLGVRIRLNSTSSGKWEHTGGIKSKFGLTAREVLMVVDTLKANQQLDCLQLMHTHLGSQIANIHDIRFCMQEVANYYLTLRQLDAPISTIDVGGGLSIDYEGTRANTGCSMNYTMVEYATHVLMAIKPLCEKAGMPEPNIISESGRALTAHHAILVANITDIEKVDTNTPLPEITQDDSYVIKSMHETYKAITDSSPREIYNYAESSLHEAHSLFKHGLLSLTEKAKIESLYTTICLEIKDKLDRSLPSENNLLKQIEESMATKIYCNLSFFQSLPDAWAIGQIFPVAPLTQLHEKPVMHCVLEDLTCDSDGTIKEYPGQDSINSTLLLPPFDYNNPYNLGFFLVGAYQEILGNLHNLFGDTNSLDLKLHDNGEFEILNPVGGDTVTNVLNYANYDSKRLLQSYEKQLINSNLRKEVVSQYLNELRCIFNQLTYLEGSMAR